MSLFHIVNEIISVFILHQNFTYESCLPDKKGGPYSGTSYYMLVACYLPVFYLDLVLDIIKFSKIACFSFRSTFLGQLSYVGFEVS